MSSDSSLPNPQSTICPEPVLRLQAPGFPPAVHHSEPSLYCRQVAMPGHDQRRLRHARVAVVGAGGLGSWIGMALARMGVTDLTIIDGDRFDRSNAPRQLMFAADIGEWKAHALARNVLPHMTGEGTVTGIAKMFEGRCGAILDELPTVLVIAVDNDAVRRAASSWCHLEQVPVVFPMLSTDGLRVQVVCQRPGGPCLRCMLPNLKDAVAPCAAAAVTSCMLAAAHTVAVVADIIMGSGSTPTWRESSLSGLTERTGKPVRRSSCVNCRPL